MKKEDIKVYFFNYRTRSFYPYNSINSTTFDSNLRSYEVHMISMLLDYPEKCTFESTKKKKKHLRSVKVLIIQTPN